MSAVLPIFKGLTPFACYRNPVLSRGNRKSIGWPLYTSANRYVLRIDDSAPKEVESSRSGRGEDIFVPMIELDKNEETCAFWNKLVPRLQKSHEDKCRLL